MYYLPLIKFLIFVGLSMLLLLTSGSELNAQPVKVYASSYGYEESPPVIVLVTIADGEVESPIAAVNSNYSDITRLAIFGTLLNNPFARYQLKFPDNLPAGTTVYIRVNGQTAGLLGLLLAGSSYITAQRDALPINENNQRSGVTNSTPPLVLADTAGPTDLILVTPQESFNAITIALNAAGLLNLLADATIDVYYAYYECPTFTVTHAEPVCTGHPFNLTVTNPISTGQYNWYSDSIGGSLLGNGPTLPRTENTPGIKHYFLQHSQFSATCPRTDVPVTVGETPDNPAVSLQ